MSLLANRAGLFKPSTVVARNFSPELKKWCYNLSGFNKYGLRREDIFHEFNPDVAEAVKRLPLKLKMERDFRCIRASQLYIQKEILPKEQWTKFEEDVPYLTPYLEEVIKERLEIEEWEKNH